MREDTPEDSSSTPVSSRWAQDWENPKGPSSKVRMRDRAVSTPVKLSIRMVTVKKRIKAQMFKVEERAPVMEWVNAAGKEAV